MKNIIGLIVLILVGITAYILLSEEDTARVNKEDYKDFAIEDTASIDRIFMSQNNGKKILISRRENGIWTVNNDFPARMDAIALILKTVSNIKIQGNVSQENINGVIKRMATGATKVEFYTGGKKPEKVWYVSEPSPNKMGTYMLLEKDGKKSSKPYVTHLLSEKGYLSSRFFVETFLWKDRVMMKINPKNIKSVSVEHFYDTATSFRIEQVTEGQFKMTNLKTNASNEIPSEIAVPYLKGFSAVFYEYVDFKTPKVYLDSIYSSLPRHTIIVNTNKGERIEMKTFNLPVIPGSQVEGKDIFFHPERMYAYSSFLGAQYHPVVQNLTFDPLTPSLEEFASSTTVEK